jgi:hypothetical protein
MRYYSPLSVLPVTAGTQPTAAELMLAKRKMLAEFELLNTSVITVNGRDFTRQDVLQLFEEWERAADLPFHMLVAGDPVLKRLLEYHEIDEGQRFTLTDANFRPGFTEWISPYFADAFADVVSSAFKTFNEQQFLTMMNNPLLMESHDEWQAWNGVEQQLESYIALVDANNAGKDVAGIDNLVAGAVLEMMSVLPRERFEATCSKYAFVLLNHAVLEFNKGNREWSQSLLAYLPNLPISDGMIDSISQKQREMAGIVKNLNKRENKNTWQVVRIVLFVLYLLFRLGSCAQHNY